MRDEIVRDMYREYCIANDMGEQEKIVGVGVVALPSYLRWFY